MRADFEHFPTPKNIIRHLDRFVHGQHQAKRALAMTAYKHLLDAAYRNRCQDVKRPFGKKHLLLIGPTGCGKTHLVRTLAQFLKVPLAFINATSLVESGYVGDHVDSIVNSLVASAEQDEARARRGIIFIDEIDKIRRQGADGGRDVSGEGVQNMLLPVLDGAPVSLQRYGDFREFDASSVWVIAAGAFVGLDDMVNHRLGLRGNFGFNQATSDVMTPDAALESVELADLKRFGLIPEFIGRFARLIPLRALSSEDLVRILSSTDESALQQQQRLFAQHGIDLEITPPALSLVAEQAVRSETHARGAERMLLESLSDLDFRLPDLVEQGVCRVTIDERVVRGLAEPHMERQRTNASRPLPVQRLMRDATRLFYGDRSGRPAPPHSKPVRRRRRSRAPSKVSQQLLLPFDEGRRTE